MKKLIPMSEKGQKIKVAPHIWASKERAYPGEGCWLIQEQGNSEVTIIVPIVDVVHLS